MTSDDETAVLARLHQLRALVMALSTYADRAPDHVKRWADTELAAFAEILDRLRPGKMLGVGASWWAKSVKG